MRQLVRHEFLGDFPSLSQKLQGWRGKRVTRRRGEAGSAVAVLQWMWSQWMQRSWMPKEQDQQQQQQKEKRNTGHN